MKAFLVLTQNPEARRDQFTYYTMLTTTTTTKFAWLKVQ